MPSDNKIREDYLTKLRLENVELNDWLSRVGASVDNSTVVSARLNELIAFLVTRGVISRQDIIEFDISFEAKLRTDLQQLVDQFKERIEKEEQDRRKTKLVLPNARKGIIHRGR